MGLTRKQEIISDLDCVPYNPLSCPPDVHCCNNKYITMEVLYLRYNRRISSTKGMCTLHVKKIFISTLLSLAIFHSYRCWGRGHESGLYSSFLKFNTLDLLVHLINLKIPRSKHDKIIDPTIFFIHT